jgi:hypothetical protein
MRPNMLSMVDELLLIKIAEEQERTGWKFPDSEEWKRLGLSALGVGAGAFIGAGLGAVARQKLKQVLPQMSDRMLTGISLGGGALTGLGSTALLRKAYRWQKQKKDDGVKDE